MKKILFVILTITCFSLSAEESFISPLYEGSKVEKAFNRGINKEIPICLQWTTQRECINRRICRIVCSAIGAGAGSAIGNGVGAAIGVGASSQICQEVCDIVPECSNIRVCVRYSTDIGFNR